MNNAVRPLAVAVFLAFSAIGASAQVITQPTPVPLVTADTETWYLNGEPITYSGNLYYPAGAQISFNSNEMVRSGSHFGVPLFVRTTDEPFSVIYVPLARGFVQPYMRPRMGDVGGTSGTAPMAGVAATYSQTAGTPQMFQAAGPPTLVAGPAADYAGLPRMPIPAIAPRSTPPGIGTTGAQPATAVGEDVSAAAVPRHTRIGPPPQGINAIFVTFRDRRWYNEGPAIDLDRARMVEIGDYRGFAVFADRDTPEQRIYITSAIGGSLVSPYTERKDR